MTPTISFDNPHLPKRAKSALTPVPVPVSSDRQVIRRLPHTRLAADHERARIRAANRHAAKASYPRGRDAGWIKYTLLLSPHLRAAIEQLSSKVFPGRPKRHMAPWIIDRLEGCVAWEEAYNLGTIPTADTVIGSMLRINAVDILRRVGMYEEAIGLAGRLLNDPRLRQEARIEIERVRDDLAAQILDLNLNR